MYCIAALLVGSHAAGRTLLQSSWHNPMSGSTALLSCVNERISDLTAVSCLYSCNEYTFGSMLCSRLLLLKLQCLACSLADVDECRELQSKLMMDSWCRCADALVEMSRDEEAEVMIATHNQKSIERAVSLMHELSIEPRTSGVYFGQLLGMADHLTFILGRNGFRVRHLSSLFASPLTSSCADVLE